jgi:hypothetical protein
MNVQRGREPARGDRVPRGAAAGGRARAGFLAGFALAAAATAMPAGAQTPPRSTPDNTGPNAAIERLSRGEYAYRTLKEGRARGSERFELLAHPDGTRTLLMWNDLYARNGQIHAVLRVDRAFRPIETKYEFWSDGKFKGTASFHLRGGVLEGVVRTPEGGIAEQRLEVPEAVSFATHPLAADGWHAWYVDPANRELQTGTLVNFDASADLTTPAGARVQPQSWRFVGRESLAVPAGRFDCERYTSGDATVWVTGPDRVLVRFEWTSLDREYVLTTFESRAERAAGPRDENRARQETRS